MVKRRVDELTEQQMWTFILSMMVVALNLFVLLLSTNLVILRNSENKVTPAGWALAACAGLGALLGIANSVVEWKQHEGEEVRRKEELYRFDPQRIQVVLYADYASQSVGGIPSLPATLEVPTAAIGSQILRFEFEKPEGILRLTEPGTLSNRARAIYHARNIRSISGNGYVHLWDLQDLELQFQVPPLEQPVQSKFGKWELEAELRLDPRLEPIRAMPDAKGVFRFRIGRIDRTRLIAG